MAEHTYNFQGRFDVSREDDGVVLHVPEPGERHIFVPRAEWEAIETLMTFRRPREHVPVPEPDDTEMPDTKAGEPPKPKPRSKK